VINLNTAPETTPNYGRSPIRPVGARYARERATKTKQDKDRAKARRLMQKQSRRRNRV
jgi:hypothetical protein